MKYIETLARVAREQRGLCTATDLATCGVTDGQRKWACANGVLVAVQPSVYRLAGAPDGRDVELLAACLSANGFACRRSAAELWQLPVPLAAHAEIVVATRHRPRLRGSVVVHRTDRLDPSDRTKVCGIPTTSIPRTVLDLGAVLRPWEVELAMEDAVLRLGASIGAFRDCLNRVGACGRNGSGVLRTIVDARDPALASPEGALNQRLHRLFRRYRLPPCTPEYWVTDGVRLDFAWPSVKVGVEGDSRRWHAGRMDVQRNAEKANTLTRLGWRVLHYTWLDSATRPRAIVAEIADFLARTDW